MTKLDEAIILAAAAHRGQVDKAGAPYILHPMRVMLAGQTDEERIVGVLHDVLEDTDVSFSQVYVTVGAKIAGAISALTRVRGEPYFDFIARVAQVPLARQVKLYDLADNLARMGPHLPEAASLTERYIKARNILTNTNLEGD